MSELNKLTTEQLDSSIVPEKKIEEKAMTAEEQAETTMKAIHVQYKGLVGGSRLHIRTLLNMLTSRGINGNLQKQIKDTIERAIVAAIDYGVDGGGKEAPIRTHGTLGKLESSLAMQLAQAKEYGMIIMSDKMDKASKEAKSATTTVAPTSEVTEQSNISKGD